MPSRHIRYRVVAFTVALAGVTYLDRISIGVLAPSIMRDLHITQLQMGFVFAAFTLAYALFEIPTAWWADRIGSRRVLTRIVLWWSAFTMLTGAAISYPILLITRFLFGAGEAGAWPNAARVFSRWIPVNERGRVQGIFFAGAHVAGGLTPAIVAWIAIVLPWRMVFVVLGFVGLAWAYSWYRWFRDEPHEHPAVTAEEVEFIERTRALPPAHEQGSWLQVLPTERCAAVHPVCRELLRLLLFYDVAADVSRESPCHGDRRTGHLLRAAARAECHRRHRRRRCHRCAYSPLWCALWRMQCWVRRLHTRDRSDAVLVLSPRQRRYAGTMIAVAGAFSRLTLAPSWSTAIRLGGRNTATLSATMNTAGQLGAFSALSFSPRWSNVSATGDCHCTLFLRCIFWPP